MDKDTNLNFEINHHFPVKGHGAGLCFFNITIHMALIMELTVLAASTSLRYSKQRTT